MSSAKKREMSFPAGSSKRSCLGGDREKSSVNTIWETINSDDPLAALSIFKVLLERLESVTKYYRDSKILLDMQELQMKLFECNTISAKKRISRMIKSDQEVTLSRYRVPGSRGTGKVVIELRHALEYILGLSGSIPTLLRRTLIEIALRAAAGDLDLFAQVSEWRKTMDPSIRSLLLSGYVRSTEAQEKDPVAPPEEVAKPLPEDSVDAGQFLCYRKSGQDMDTWLQKECGLTKEQTGNAIFSPLRKAAVLGMTREIFEKLMDEALAEWKRYCRSVQLAAQKKEEWMMKATDRERQFNHDAAIEVRREERKTFAVQTSRIRMEEELKLKAQRLTERNAEKEHIRKQQEHEHAASMADRQDRENQQKRTYDAARFELEVNEKEKQRVAEAEEKEKQRVAEAAEKERDRAAEQARLKALAEEAEKQRKADEHQRELEGAKLRYAMLELEMKSGGAVKRAANQDLMRPWIRAFERAVSGTHFQGTMVTTCHSCGATNACMISCSINVRALPAKPRLFCRGCSRLPTIVAKYTDGQWLQSPRFDRERMGSWVRECGLHTRGTCRCCDEPVTLTSFQSCHNVASANGGASAMENLRVGCGVCNRAASTRDFDRFCVEDKGVSDVSELRELLPMDSAMKVMDWLTGKIPALPPNLLKRSQCLAASVPASATIYTNFFPES